MSSRLETLVSVRDVARVAGWTYRRMLRHLKTLDDQTHGMLLVRQGSGFHVRYSLTLSALEQLRPQWFAKVTTLTARVEELEKNVRELEGLLVEAHREIGSLKGTGAGRRAA